jgi:transposase
MRSIEEREDVLNMYFYEGKGYKEIAKTLGIPLDTVKSWCRRYRLQNNIPQRGRTPLAKEPLSQRTICRRKSSDDENSQEARIARLEMEVDLLRNFLILTEGR